MFTVILLALLAMPPETSAVSDKGEKLVCRYEKMTNSRFAKRVCRSVAQMEARSIRDSELFRQSQTAASQCTLVASPATGQTGC